jgi:hypothetical protein
MLNTVLKGTGVVKGAASVMLALFDKCASHTLSKSDIPANFIAHLVLL